MESKLHDFLFKHVDVVDIYGKEYKHYFVDVYESALDSDEDEESIGMGPYEHAKTGVWLYAHEIKSIKLSE